MKNITNEEPKISQKWSSYKEHKGNALAPRAEEGRDKLRKAAGSCKWALYPQISEWSNPTGGKSGHHILNK